VVSVHWFKSDEETDERRKMTMVVVKIEKCKKDAWKSIKQ